MVITLGSIKNEILNNNKNVCLSEGISKVNSYEESHYNWRSFQRTIPKAFGIRMTKKNYYEKQNGENL